MTRPFQAPPPPIIEPPRSVQELQERFANEDACETWLTTLRWPHGFICPRCQSRHAWRKSRGLYQCGSCDLETSLTAGTLFHGTRKPLKLWFRAMWFVVSTPEPATALGLQQMIGLPSYETAWTWLYKIRQAMVPVPPLKLVADVEVGTFTLPGPNSVTGGSLGEAYVAVAAEVRRGSARRIRMKRVDALLPSRLLAFEREALATDARPVPADQMVNRAAMLAERWLALAPPGAAGWRQFDGLLDEFVFRHNTPDGGRSGEFFRRLVEQAVQPRPAGAFEE